VRRLVARLRDIMAAFLRHAIAEQQARGGRSLSQSQVPALLQAVELDASTPAKFSRHLIFPGFVVASTQHAGAFMRALAASPNMTSDVRVSSLVCARVHADHVSCRMAKLSWMRMLCICALWWRKRCRLALCACLLPVLSQRKVDGGERLLLAGTHRHVGLLAQPLLSTGRQVSYPLFVSMFDFGTSALVPHPVHTVLRWNSDADAACRG
jgi:hypothetical protein